MRSPRHREIVGALASVGSVGDSYDDALAESTIGQIKTFPPDTVTAWAYAAYRRHLGLRPFPARPRSGLDVPRLTLGHRRSAYAASRSLTGLSREPSVAARAGRPPWAVLLSTVSHRMGGGPVLTVFPDRGTASAVS